MPEYLSAIEAANLLGVSESYIRKRIKSGTLDAKKVRGKWGILRGDLDGLDGLGEPSEPHEPDKPSDAAGEPDGRSEPSEPDKPSTAEWREDLLAQVARLEADKAALREDFGLRVEASKARVIDLERSATMRESRIADMEMAHASEVSDLRGQVAILEAKVRETLEAHTEKLGDLASDIAELANAKAQMEVRVYELEPVASQVPMLQAAVEEKDATLSDRERELQLREHELSNVRDDLEAIASRPVAGPVFRLLTKGKLRV
jgi:excisionase family DNA binding protein